jgi:uncharacterized protein involved in outer membrane biogenesis
MATIGRFEVQVALIPLISGTIDIRKVVLEGADVLLEKNAEGQVNYAFERATSEQTAEASPGAPTIPVLRHVLIENARISYKDAVSEQATTLVVDKLSMKTGGVDAPVDLSFAGSYNENPIEASGTLGSRNELLSAGRPWPVALTLEGGGANIDLKGTVTNVLTAPILDLNLSVKGETLATLSKLAGAPVPPLGPYSVDGKVSGDIGATLKLSGLAAKVGGSDLSGTMSVDLGGQVPAIEGTFNSTRIDIADFVRPGGPDTGTTASAKDDGRVFPDDPLPLDGLRAVDAIVEISIETLIAALEAKNVEIGLYLKGGDLRVAPLKALASDGNVDGTVRLDASADTPALDASVKVSKFDAGKFLADMAITDLLEGRLNINIDLKGQGGSVRALMASLNGRTQVAMGSGRMKSTALDTFIGGPTKMLAGLVAGEQSEYTVINCVVSHFDIENGLATSKALLFDTDNSTISGKGTINLASEALDLEIDPQPKSATVNTAVPVVIQGTLAEPSYSLSKLATARKIGGLLGAIIFPPALIIGLAETGTGEENPCLKGAKGKPAARQATPEKPETESANPVTEPLKAIGEGVGGALKKLFGN